VRHIGSVAHAAGDRILYMYVKLDSMYTLYAHSELVETSSLLKEELEFDPTCGT